MNPKILNLLIVVLILSCNSVQSPKNNLELELDKIQVNTEIEDLKNEKFVNFKVDWKNADKYESSCETYGVIPLTDTFEFEYYLDFCYDKFNWWNRNKKSINNSKN